MFFKNICVFIENKNFGKQLKVSISEYSSFWNYIFFYFNLIWYDSYYQYITSQVLSVLNW